MLRITRFINGRKVYETFSENIVVENEVITGTIDRINARIKRKHSDNANKVNLNG